MDGETARPAANACDHVDTALIDLNGLDVNVVVSVEDSALAAATQRQAEDSQRPQAVLAGFQSSI